METIQIESTGKIRKNKESIEKKLDVKITIKGKKAEIKGDPIEEYEASMIIDALDFGFSLKDALKITDEDVVFRKLPIKQFTTRKNLEEVRGRIIGTEGKTKRAVEQISGCALVLHQNTVGIIGLAENIEEATTALKSLIKGSKQTNVYKFLERMNTAKRGKPFFKLKDEEERRAIKIFK